MEEHTAQSDIVVVVQLVDSLDLPTDVELLDGVVQVHDGGVLGVTAENFLGLLGPVSMRVSKTHQKHELAGDSLCMGTQENGEIAKHWGKGKELMCKSVVMVCCTPEDRDRQYAIRAATKKSSTHLSGR